MVLSGDFLKKKTLSCLISEQKEIFHSNFVPFIAKQHHTNIGANIPTYLYEKNVTEILVKTGPKKQYFEIPKQLPSIVFTDCLIDL